MQFQSDILDTAVIRPKVTETTALGAAYLAGLAVGYWESLDEVKKQWQVERKFEPVVSSSERDELRRGWDDAVGRTLTNKC